MRLVEGEDRYADGADCDEKCLPVLLKPGLRFQWNTHGLASKQNLTAHILSDIASDGPPLTTVSQADKRAGVQRAALNLDAGFPGRQFMA